MRISFQKEKGEPALGVAFFWRLEIEGGPPLCISDLFIPELFYDFFFIETGAVHCENPAGETAFPLPRQTLKTLHTHRVTFSFSAPLVIFGARLSLPFAETYWGKNLPANAFLEENWLSESVANLPDFASQISEHLRQKQVKKTAGGMVSPLLEESDWLADFSPRHKRRLYQSVFGISHQKLRAIQNIHAFLGETCNFSSPNPRIIEYINADVFYDQPHLNRAFKKMTGLSPLEYFVAGSILQDNLMAASYN